MPYSMNTRERRHPSQSTRSNLECNPRVDQTPSSTKHYASQQIKEMYYRCCQTFADPGFIRAETNLVALDFSVHCQNKAHSMAVPALRSAPNRSEKNTIRSALVMGWGVCDMVWEHRKFVFVIRCAAGTSACLIWIGHACINTW